MQNGLQEEIHTFHASIKARALLIAIEWAGSQSLLAERLAMTRYAVTKWVERGGISPRAAISLERIKGFPLRFEEMCPGVDKNGYAPRRCPHCNRSIKPLGYPTGCQPLLKAHLNRLHKKAVRKRSKPARKPKQQAANLTALAA